MAVMDSGHSIDLTYNCDGKKGICFSIASIKGINQGRILGEKAYLYVNGELVDYVDRQKRYGGYSSNSEVSIKITTEQDKIIEQSIINTADYQPQEEREVSQEKEEISIYPKTISRGQYSFKVNNEFQEKAIKEFLGIEPQGVDLDTYLSNLDEQGLKFWADYWHDRFYQVGLTGSAFSFTTAKYNEYLAILRNSAQHQAEDGILKLYFKNKISGTEYNKIQSNLTKITGVVSRFLPAPVKIKKAVVNSQENSVDIYVSDTAFIISTSVLILIMASLTFMGFLVHKITYLLKGNQEAHYEASKETLYKDLTNSGLSPEQALKVMNSIYGEEFGGEDNKTSIGEVVSDITMLLPVVIIFMLLSSLKK